MAGKGALQSLNLRLLSRTDPALTGDMLGLRQDFTNPFLLPAPPHPPASRKCCSDVDKAGPVQPRGASLGYTPQKGPTWDD